ncbi:HAD family hydrolase [Hydrogenoanaerobacterium sp.]|uniref:HAD family hydrolase n=1 Tax=Hydrogenoanaerobacterium sp. TaxID=2953763 RepID=UPI0028979C6F|nr:HAD family hydrolase [Hydrogenoanaerobacterium sp.]
MSTLYITDLDGTLFDNTSQVSEPSAKIINSLIDEGVLFSVATARSTASAMEKLSAIRFRLPIALMNGVLLFDTVTHTYINHFPIDAKTAAAVIDTMDEFGHTAYVFTFAENQLYANYKKLTTSFQRQFREERKASRLKQFEQVSDFRTLLGMRDIIFFSMTGTYDELLPLCNQLKSTTAGLNILMYEDHVNRIWFLEAFDAHASKANAMLYLKQYCGAAETVCFGDNYNDVDMMHEADRSYAVANAVDAAKQAATSVIGYNYEGAVAALMQEECKKAGIL